MNYLRFVFASIVLLGSAVSLEAATATWDRNPESTVIGYRLSYGTQSGVHPTMIDVGNVVTFQFFPPAGQRYYVVVQAIDASGGVSAKSAEVIYDAPIVANQPPVLTQPANRSSAQNTAVSLTLVATDPEGAIITYGATGLPPGLTINAATGVIAGTVTTAGTYTVTASASDGALTATRTFTWTVAANQPPVLTQPANQTNAQNTAASLTLTATDPEGSTLTYGASGLPPGLSVNASTGVISGTVSTAGTYTVTASVSDGSLSATRTFSWTVTTSSSGSTTVVLSPVDTSIDVFGGNYVNNQRLYAYTYPANQVGQAILMKFDLSQIPANAVIQSATLEASLVAMDGDTTDPNYSVSLHQIINRNPDLTRATGTTADGVANWTASTCCYQNVPMAQSDISPARAVTVVDRTLGVKTWDALALVQAWVGAPASNYGLLLNADATKGINRYRAFGSAQQSSAASRPSLRIVYGTGSPADTIAPTVSLSAPNANATVSGTNVTVSASAADAVGVVGVQFRLDGVNIGAEDTTAPYSITWNSITATNGAHSLTAIARDAAGNATTSAARTVTVSNALPNSAPTLTQPSNQTTAEGSAASLALVASDPDGNPLTFSATGLPAGLTINATTGVISGTPSFTSAGAFSVTATVSDGTLSASRTFSWTVTNTNRAPVLTQPANQTSAEGAAVALSLSGSDPDSDPISFSATGLPAGLTINIATGAISGTVAYSSAGTYSVTATITDGSLSQSRTFSWTVTNVNRAPVYAQPANQTSAEGAAASIALVASDPDGDTLTYTATGLPAGASINATTGLISGTLGYTSAGTYTVNTTVSDGTLSVSRTFSWTVTNTNRAPVVTAVADQTTPADTNATLQIVASDPDGTALTYAATGLPPALTISATTGLISGHVNATSAGVHLVTVTVTDGALTSSTSFVWSVDGTDVPVRGDFDGDGRDDPATYREATGEWRVWLSTNNFAAGTPIVWGTGTDVAVSADYDGDGRFDIAVYRPSTGTWHALLSSTNMQSSLVIQWGDANDRPVAIDYDNDGRADLALPRFGGYQILLSGSNYTNSVTVR